MGKEGPCYHCGVTSTPLWRNGPPDKPVLCNACGSRWRTKGSLANYFPLHSRADPSELQDNRMVKFKHLPTKNKEPKVIMRKQKLVSGLVKRVGFDCNQGLKKVIDEGISNHSSSGSAMSNSDSCVQFDSADTSDLTGPSQSNVWGSAVPSKKRTCPSLPKPSPSPIEKLTKDLYAILCEQQQSSQSSLYSGSCEDELLFESDAPMVSVEIGHGSVLIRHPSYIAKEEESVASSFPMDNKFKKANEADSRVNAPLVSNNQGANVLTPGVEKIRKCNGLGIQSEQLKREKTQREMVQILGNPYSSLCCVDLSDVLNFVEFEQHLTYKERQQLLEYLPSSDNDEQSNSLKCMFASAQFKENISSFQKLLAEGVFDLSFSGVEVEECKMLRKLVLGNSTKSKWVEHYNLLKEVKCKSYNEGSVVQQGSKSVASAYSTNLKRPRECQFQKQPGAKPTMKIPKRGMKDIYQQNEQMYKDGSCFSPKTLFMSPAAKNSLISNSFVYMDESSDQDLLLDVPSNGSFPEAELLLPSSSFGAQTSTSTSYMHPQLYRPR